MQVNIDPALLSALPIPSYIIGKDLTCIACNEQNSQNLGLESPGDYAGKTIADLTKSTHVAAIVNARIELVIASKTPQTAVDCFLSLEGKEVVMVDAQYPIYDPNGEVIGVHGFDVIISHSDSGMNQNLISEIKHKYLQQHPLLKKLTKKQKECLALLLRGYSTKSIATKLGLSPRTIETRIIDIRFKFSAFNRDHLIDICYETGVAFLLHI